MCSLTGNQSNVIPLTRIERIVAVRKEYLYHIFAALELCREIKVPRVGVAGKPYKPH
jgi:RNase P/RNase MRP subunit POP5